MHQLITYILKVILCSAIFFGYYRVALRNKNFHPYNRFYLLSTAVLSALLPLLHISMFDFSSDNERMLALFQLLGSGQLPDVVVSTGPKPINWELIALFGSLAVTMVMLTIMAVRINRVFRIKRKFPKKTVDNINFINTNIEQAPFSFLNNLFWRKDILLSDSVGKQIYRHELAHIQQKHSLDKLLMQVLSAIFWMNPIYYYMQRELALIHEFMADQQAVGQGDTEAFARMLLATQYSGFRFEPAHPLTYSSIKKRLNMITNSHKPKYSYLRRLLFLPLLFTVTFVFALRAHQKQMADQTAHLQAMVNEHQADDLPVENINGFQPTVSLSNHTPLRQRTITFTSADSTNPKDTTSVNFTATNKPAPLIIVDGQQMPASFTLSDLKAEDIQRMDVHKDKLTTSKYGQKGLNGVVLITTRTAAAKSNKPITVVGFKKEDGSQQLKTTKVVQSGQDQAKEITVQGFGTAHKAGAAAPAKKLKGKVRGVLIRGVGKEGKNPLYIVDGKKIGQQDLENMSPDDIESITILKESSATSLYGKQAADGAILIQTKAFVKAHPTSQQAFAQNAQQARFPGGQTAWIKYLEHNLRVQTPVDNHAPAGTYNVTVSFLVDKQGKLSEIKAIAAPKNDYGTAAEAVRVIAHSGKWLPATIKGKPVIFRQKQKIVFEVSE